MSIDERIEGWVKAHPVVLFMKGTRGAPRCGFSAAVVAALDDFLDEYVTVDVLEEPEVREGIKAYSSWPTIPQLYVNGEFVGGADIVREMNESGELEPLLGVSRKAPPDPSVRLTESAKRALLRFHEGEGQPGVRLEITPRYEYGMDFGAARAGDVVREQDGVTLMLDRASASRADGLVVDFVDGPDGGGFKIDNPNEPPKVRQVDPSSIARMLREGEIEALYDVRTEEERAIAAIEGSILLDQEAGERLEALPKSTPIAFYCHHGQRSHHAATHFLRLGFTRVYNLAGGIDAWSVEEDARVPRY
jgi:monothiol glutaredoxin